MEDAADFRDASFNPNYVSGRLMNAASHTDALIRSTGIIWEAALCKPWGLPHPHTVDCVCSLRVYIRASGAASEALWSFSLPPVMNCIVEQHVLYNKTVWLRPRAVVAEILLFMCLVRFHCGDDICRCFIISPCGHLPRYHYGRRCLRDCCDFGK